MGSDVPAPPLLLVDADLGEESAAPNFLPELAKGARVADSTRAR